jgi:hypothetical protein
MIGDILADYSGFTNGFIFFAFYTRPEEVARPLKYKGKPAAPDESSSI